jgi:hypothetical protein
VKFLLLLLLATGNWRLATALETEQGKPQGQNRGMCTQVVCVESLDILGDNLVIPPPPGQLISSMIQ